MKESNDRYWMRFGEPEQSSSYTGKLAGKYLFFCERQAPLVALARDEIENHYFEVAKVSQNARGGNFVCCLYWHDDSRRYELFIRHRDEEHLKYRWWKSNADTRAGKYSKQFKQADPDPQPDPVMDDLFGVIHDEN
jgi:hypothetical protein